MDILKITELFQHGKLFGHLKAFLNLIFNISITYAIFFALYPLIKLPDFNSMASLSMYFIKGYFVIPLGIYFFVWGLTEFIGFVVFEEINTAILSKWKTSLLNLPLKNRDQIEIDDTQSIVMKLKNTRMEYWIVTGYLDINQANSEINASKFVQASQSLKRDSETDFRVLVRSIVALPLYFFQVEYLGWRLLIGLILIQLFIGVLLILVYQMTNGLIIVARRYEKQYPSVSVANNELTENALLI